MTGVRTRWRLGRGLPLATWLAIGVSSLMGVLTLAGGGAAFLFGREAIERETMRSLNLLAEARGQALAERLGGVRDRAGQLLLTLDLRCGESDAECRRSLVENFARIQGAVAARLAGRAGVILVGPPSLTDDLGAVPPAAPPVLALVRTVGGERHLAVRVTGADVDLTLLFPHTYIDPIFASRFGLGERGETFLADADGYFVTPGRYPSDQGHSHPIDARPMVACLRGRAGAMIAPDYRNVLVIHGFRPVPELGGGCIMAHAEYAEALAPVRAFGGTIAGIAAASLILAVGASVAMGHLLASSLARLATRAEALAAGDLESPVPVEGPAEVRAYALVFADMARSLRERMDELDTARRELDSFNASVTHDLRAPLRAIEGFSAALAEEAGDALSATSAEYLRRIRGAVRRMTRLVDDLLTLSRVSQSELVQVRVDLSATACSVAAELARGDPTRSVTFEIAPGLAAAGDPGLLHVLFANLLGNAWKFTARTPDARIEVFATRIDGESVFAVRDNGVGFDPALAGRLYQPFSRLHADQAFEGTGIGLATVARVVHRHGGRTWAEGAVGKGATFYFTLPAVGRASFSSGP